MLENFFQPQSVAVIGASETPGKVGHEILQNLLKYRFPGKIYPINLKSKKVCGRKAYPNVTSVQGKIDLAVFAIPALSIPPYLEDCASKEIDSAVVISAGFKESGVEGARLERYMAHKARELGIRIVGPNCLGIIDSWSKLNASFARGMPEQGKIAFFSQSGALCTSILDWAIAKQIGFSKFISLGNKADIGEVDILQTLAEDPNTDVILGYIEGVADGVKFLEVARSVTRNKPVIVIKSGVTGAGAKAASSHTGTLAGSENAFSAACEQSGIIRASSVEELFDYALSFAYQPLPKGRNVAIITNGGGPGILAADAVEQSIARMASFDKKTIDALQRFLPSSAAVYNPVDVLGDASDGEYERAMREVLRDTNVHGVVAIFVPQAISSSEEIANAISRIASRSKKPILAALMGGAAVEIGRRVLAKDHVPTFPFPERAVAAFHGMVKYSAFNGTTKRKRERFQFDRRSITAVFTKVKREGRTEVVDTEARDVLAACGFRVPNSSLAQSATEAASAAKEIGYPVVMKIASPDISHKSDVGGVRVGLRNAQEVRRAYHEMVGRASSLLPDAEIWGVAVQEMIVDAREVIIGMSTDPQFGPLLMFGLGGIYVEALKDVSFRIGPISRTDAASMMREIRSLPLLMGIRGEKRADIESVEEALLRVSQLVTDFPEILELDVNPLAVLPESQGVVAIDARMTLGGD